MKHFLLSIMFSLIAASASAHGVEALSVDGAARAVEIRYSTGEPMAYAEIKVYSPSSPDIEVIAGFADRNGRYAFLPDEEGDWRLEATDGMGHKAALIVSHTLGDKIAASIGGKSPLYMRALLGVSLILNIFALYSFLTRRKRRAHQ